MTPWLDVHTLDPAWLNILVAQALSPAAFERELRIAGVTCIIGPGQVMTAECRYDRVSYQVQNGYVHQARAG